MRSVTLPYLLRRGAKSFCWLHPTESVDSAHGAFMYTFANGSSPVAFHLVNPKAMKDVHEREASQLKQLERSNILKRAYTRSSFNREISHIETEDRNNWQRRKAQMQIATLANLGKSVRSLSVRSMVGGRRTQRTSISAPLNDDVDKPGADANRPKSGAEGVETASRSSFCAIM